MSSPAYPPFVPPPRLSKKRPPEWTSREADDYLEWQLSVLRPRTDALLAYFNEDSAIGPPALLQRIGLRAEAELRLNQFSFNDAEGRCLTNFGYALAADLGLLVARLIQQESAEITWTVKRKPKNDLSFNLPVLIGFTHGELEPVGGSIAEATAVLRGWRSADAWLRVYTFWVERLPKASKESS